MTVSIRYICVKYHGIRKTRHTHTQTHTYIVIIISYHTAGMRLFPGTQSIMTRYKRSHSLNFVGDE